MLSLNERVEHYSHLLEASVRANTHLGSGDLMLAAATMRDALLQIQQDQEQIKRLWSTLAGFYNPGGMDK